MHEPILYFALTTVNSSEVKALTFEYATQQNETARKTIENESLRHLIVPIEEEADKTTHMWTNARLVVVSPVLDSTPAAWKLKLDGRVISAKMTDQDFLSKMDKEKIAFAKNDILIADLETIVTKSAINISFLAHAIFSLSILVKKSWSVI